MGHLRLRPRKPGVASGVLPRPAAARDPEGPTARGAARQVQEPSDRDHRAARAHPLARRLAATPRQALQRTRTEAIHASPRLADRRGATERIMGGVPSTAQRLAVLQRVPPHRAGDVVMVELGGTTYHGEVLDLDEKTAEYLVKLHFEGTGGRMVTLKYDEHDALTEAGKPVRVTPYGKNKEDAQADLTAAQRHVYGLIRAGARTEAASPRDLLWRNTCEWLLADNGVRLTIVVPTHDMTTRARDWRKAPTYFDFDTAFPAEGGDYGGEGDPRVAEIEKKTSAYLERATSRMVVPMIPERFSEDELRATLIHETQHHADRHRRGDRWAERFGKGEKRRVRKETQVPPDTLLEAMGSFRSEFRAYFVERLFSGRLAGTALDAKGIDALTEELARDAGVDIKRHIAGEYPYAADLRKVEFFASAIHDLLIPTGGNLLNSVRVEALVAAVEAYGDRGLRKGKAPVGDWRKIIASMHPLEFQFLLDGRFCREFWTSMESGGKKVPDLIRGLLEKGLADAH